MQCTDGEFIAVPGVQNNDDEDAKLNQVGKFGGEENHVIGNEEPISTSSSNIPPDLYQHEARRLC